MMLVDGALTVVLLPPDAGENVNDAAANVNDGVEEVFDATVNCNCGRCRRE